LTGAAILSVMAGLDPAIQRHNLQIVQPLDARLEAGHDAFEGVTDE